MVMFSGLGAMFLAMGLLSYVLPAIGVQFQLVKLVEKIHPAAGMLFIVGGGILFVLGLFLDRRPGAIKLMKTLAKLEKTDPEEPKSSGRSGWGAVVVLALLAGVGYYLHTEHHVFDPLVQAFQKELQKHQANNTTPTTNAAGTLQHPEGKKDEPNPQNPGTNQTLVSIPNFPPVSSPTQVIPSNPNQVAEPPLDPSDTHPRVIQIDD
jgi:hypothetical protein